MKKNGPSIAQKMPTLTPTEPSCGDGTELAALRPPGGGSSPNDAAQPLELVLRHIIDSIPYSVFWKDINSVYLGCNRRFLKDTGKADPSDVVGKDDFSMPWKREEAEFYRKCDREVMASGMPVVGLEEPQRNAAGETTWLWTSKVPLRSARGDIFGILGIYADITDRKRIEDDLRTAKEAAESASRAKSDFISTVTHELRTPLTLILGPLEALIAKSPDAPPELHTVRRNALRLLGLVNDVLDSAKLEAGQMKAKSEAVNVAELLSDLVDDAREFATAKDLELSFHVADELASTPAVTDRFLVERLVQNLLGNALKFTPSGGKVTITLFAEQDVLRIAVADTGPGIPFDHQELIFERFRQIDASPTRSHEGTGIGLALVKDIVSLLGGKVTVESSPGQGATFHVHLPRHLALDEQETVTSVAPASERVEGRPSAKTWLWERSGVALEEPASSPCVPSERADSQPSTVLLVEDNGDMRDYMRGILERDGHKCVGATNGLEALEALGRCHPGAIVTDIMMPKMDGLTLVARLREDPNTCGIPTIIVTARTGDDAVAAGLNRGATDYLTKPFSPIEFSARVQAALRMSALYRDVERRKRETEAALHQLQETQEQLRQAEKMSAVGQLAAGVAHEINNPLGIILGFAQGMERRVPEGDALRLPVASIVREGLRCRNLVQELLTFSRTARRTTEEVDLNALVRSTTVLLEARAKTQCVEIVQELHEPLPALRANRTQLQQVIVNLGTNAMDAMSGGGRLTLRTRLHGGGTAVLDVADTGTGIPEELRARIFEPFFTTKEVGKGTGLGLSLVYEIIQQHHGKIAVQDQAGRGTVMSVELPAAAVTAATTRAAGDELA